MAKNIEEIKQFILWAKSQKIQALKIQDVEVAFSPLAFIDEPEVFNKSPLPEENDEVETSLPEFKEPVKNINTGLTPEEEELLFHSSNP